MSVWCCRTASAFSFFHPKTLMLLSQPAVAKILPSARTRALETPGLVSWTELCICETTQIRIAVSWVRRDRNVNYPWQTSLMSFHHEGTDVNWISHEPCFTSLSLYMVIRLRRIHKLFTRNKWSCCLMTCARVNLNLLKKRGQLLSLSFPVTSSQSDDWAANERLNGCWTWQKKPTRDSGASIIGRKTFKREGYERRAIWFGK